MIEFKSVLEPDKVAAILAEATSPMPLDVRVVQPYYDILSKKWHLDGSNDLWLHVKGKENNIYSYMFTWRSYADVPDVIKVPADFTEIHHHGNSQKMVVC